MPHGDLMSALQLGCPYPVLPKLSDKGAGRGWKWYWAMAEPPVRSTLRSGRLPGAVTLTLPRSL